MYGRSLGGGVRLLSAGMEPCHAKVYEWGRRNANLRWGTGIIKRGRNWDRRRNYKAKEIRMYFVRFRRDTTKTTTATRTAGVEEVVSVALSHLAEHPLFYHHHRFKEMRFGIDLRVITP